MRSNTSRLWLPALACLAIAGVCAADLAARTPNNTPGAALEDAVQEGRFRALAPGVEKTIPATPETGSTFDRHDIVELLAEDPEFGERPFSKGRSPAKNVVFHRDVWNLEFTFKPVRFIDVDLPTRDGRMQRKQIWYMIYRVKNTGQVMRRTVNAEGLVKIDMVDAQQPVRFVPRFVLESWDAKKFYPDRLLPLAVDEIQLREDATTRIANVTELLPESPTRLLNTVEMTREIAPSPPGQDLSVWGVVTWEDIDPTTDHFSIYVQGLTNAYNWQDAKAGDPPAYVYKANDKLLTGRKLTWRTLRLNFWRPGDAFYEHEREIRFGYFPHPGDDRFKLKPEEKVDYLWLYR